MDADKALYLYDNPIILLYLFIVLIAIFHIANPALVTNIIITMITYAAVDYVFYYNGYIRERVETLTKGNVLDLIGFADTDEVNSKITYPDMEYTPDYTADKGYSADYKHNGYYGDADDRIAIRSKQVGDRDLTTKNSILTRDMNYQRRIYEEEMEANENAPWWGREEF